MTHQEIEQQLRFYEDKENLQQVQQRLNDRYRHIRDIIALEYIEIVQKIEDEEEKAKVIEMLKTRNLYPVRGENGKFSLPESGDVVVFDEDFELEDIAYDFQTNNIRINPKLISSLYQSYLKLANRQVRNTEVKDIKDIRTNMDAISYLYNNNISFEEYSSLLLPHESIHQWTLGIHRVPQSNEIGFSDEGLVEEEARRISGKYSIDSIKLRMAEVAAAKPLTTNMSHAQKIQMMMTSNYGEEFSQYGTHVGTINRYIRKSYSSSSKLLIDRFEKYDSISPSKVSNLAEDLVNGNTKELTSIREELDENSICTRFKIPSAE